MDSNFVDRISCQAWWYTTTATDRPVQRLHSLYLKAAYPWRLAPSQIPSIIAFILAFKLHLLSRQHSFVLISASLSPVVSRIHWEVSTTSQALNWRPHLCFSSSSFTRNCQCSSASSRYVIQMQVGRHIDTALTCPSTVSSSE